MDDKLSLFAVKYIFAPYGEINPRECVVYIGGSSMADTRKNFESELDAISRKYKMCYKVEVKEISCVDCGTHRILLQDLGERT